MKNNALKEVFNLVAATKEKGLIFSHFNPLSEAKVTELQNAITKALKTKEVKDNTPLTESLLQASGAIDKYTAMPKTFQEPIYTSVGNWPYTSTVLAGYKSVENGDRPRTLKKMQRKLYKTLKKT